MTDDENLARNSVLQFADSKRGLERLDMLTALLRAENDLQNLVARPTLESIWQRHVLDSAQLLLHVPRETSTWLDLGTGAGFPGIVVAALRPGYQITLVESRARRIEWLRRLSARLELANVEVMGSRVESIPTKTFDVISARAFAPLTQLLQLSSRFSSPATCWVLPKGKSAAQELQELQGWHHRFHVKQSLTDSDAGIVVGQLLGRKGVKA